MKTTYKPIALIILLLTGWYYPLRAQFAGPDKTVSRTDGPQEVLIGMPDNNPYVCYQWVGEHIISDNEKPQIRVSPMDSVTIYNVKRISQNGIEEDQVKVFITDMIKIDSIVPLHSCWRQGSAISINDFAIYTTPAGMSQQIRIARGSTTAKGRALIAETDTTVTLEALVNNQVTDQKSVGIHVVNNQVMIDNTPNAQFAMLSETGNWTRAKLNNIRSQMGVLQGSGNAGSPMQQLNIQNKKFKDCGCPTSAGNQVFNTNEALISLTASSAYANTFALPTSAGMLSLMPLKATVNLSLSLDYNDTLRLSDCANEEIMPLNPHFSANTKLSLNELHKNIIYGNATSTTQATIGDCHFDFTDGKVKWGDINMEVKGNVSLKMITLTQGNYEVNLLEEKVIR